VGAGGAGSTSSPTAAPTPSVVTPISDKPITGEPEPTARFLPKPEDFTTAIRPLRTTCGLTIRPAPDLADQRVAHCRIAYRTAVAYHGEPLDPTVTYIVRYQVIGTVNGSETYAFRITGTHVTALPLRTAVPSPGTRLAGVANEVERAS
jgi:hypothetical protein